MVCFNYTAIRYVGKGLLSPLFYVLGLTRLQRIRSALADNAFTNGVYGFKKIWDHPGVNYYQGRT